MLYFVIKRSNFLHEQSSKACLLSYTARNEVMKLFSGATLALHRRATDDLQ